MEAIRDNGRTALFLPPYSPFFDPIEECWSNIKGKVRKTPLLKSETIADRIEEAAKKVTTKDCQGWIHHPLVLFTKCMNMERI